MATNLQPPPAPKCPKGVKCSGAATSTESIYVPECLVQEFKASPLLGNPTVMFQCPSCRSSITFQHKDEVWQVKMLMKS